ncbi:hypothetical protein [Vibrio mexicanus]|uniref:hypothetical protein n=1 Tax=Vibrio mexicanus TaxID=1004326 RepID=UPI0006999C01|nr:hypothetical protein [Vibrio mexicanus]
MSSKRVVIHVGPGKTGSSAIQAWLNTNRDMLEEHGIMYPKHKLGSNTISSGHIDHALKNVNGKWECDSEKINQLLGKFYESSAHTLLLSSEYFFHSITEFLKLIPNAEFILYIRNPVELLESGYNQSVKRHSNIACFVPPERLEHFVWPYLDKLVSLHTAKPFIFRPYHSDLFEGGSIVSDLLSALGISYSHQPKQVNASYTFPALEYKRLLNYFFIEKYESELDALLQTYTQGESRYSLMKKESLESLNGQNVDLMANFITKHHLNHLEPLMALFKQKNDKPLLEQQKIKLTDLVAVDDFVRTKSPKLHTMLKAKVGKHRNLFIDNDIIYSVFHLEPDMSNHTAPSELVDVANKFTVHPSKRGKIMFELANMYFEKECLELAIRHASASLHFNPIT